MLINVLHI